MLDFGKLFNIIFVAATGALILFFLSVIIAVAVKGKRKCRAGDVLLRIFATIVFIAATAMLACSVLTMLNGSFAIAATDAGGKATAVFVFNGDLIELPIAELFVALSTTIGSELVAGLFLFSLVALIVDCLVANKKTGKKAKAVEATVKETNTAVNSTTTEASETEESKQSESVIENDSAPETDWRAENQESKQAEFVGIKEESDNAFDTFDDIEEEEKSDSVENEEVESEEEDNFDIDKILNEVEENQEVDDEQPEIDNSENEEDASDEDLSWIEQGNDETELEDEPELEQEELQEDEPQEYAESEPEYLGDTQLNSENDNNNDNYYYDDDQIEPNRDIYIPKVRTVVRRSEAQVEITVKKQTSAKKSTAVVQKRNAAQSSSAAKKSTTTSSASKRSTASKNTQSKTTSAQKRTSSDIPAEKKLPVTRRYVILNRRNAVNMFGEYLKERSQAEKDKLKSSINTIIIE